VLEMARTGRVAMTRGSDLLQPPLRPIELETPEVVESGDGTHENA
jgi:hypothetical protein